MLLYHTTTTTSTTTSHNCTPHPRAICSSRGFINTFPVVAAAAADYWLLLFVPVGCVSIVLHIMWYALRIGFV